MFKGAGEPFIEDVVTELGICSDKEGVEGVIQVVSKCARCLVRGCILTIIVCDDSHSCQMSTRTLAFATTLFRSRLL